MINRREAWRRASLASAAFALGLAGAPGRAESLRRGLVATDSGPIRDVLVHAPATAPLPKHLEWGSPLPPAGQSTLLARAREHGEFVKLLEKESSVRRFSVVLDEAIAACPEDMLRTYWLPLFLDAMARPDDEADADAHAAAENQPPGRAAEATRALVKLLPSLIFTRDLAAMTPKGLVLGRLVNIERKVQSLLLRFALQWSPTLRKYPVAFDACAEEVFLQGGDLIAVDENTLLLGVGNLTEPVAARMLARKLGMDVVAVRLPGDGQYPRDVIFRRDWTKFRTLFLHLDSVVGLVGPKTALMMPYIFEAQYAGRDSHRLVGAFRRSLGKTEVPRHGLGDIGRIQVFRATTGEPMPGTGPQKLGDYLKTRGFATVHLGGTAPTRFDDDYFATQVVPEALGLAANVLASGPGRVIAYQGSPHTERALRAAGVDVATFPSAELGRLHGGPHCLTMPLERLAAS